MKNVIPIFYSEYGRYISRFRAIPFNIDCLKPVERRVLLVLYQIARDRYVKSAKIIGDVIGRFHPHGDSTTYGSLIQMTHDGYVDDQGGSWGTPGLTDTSASQMRYTEARLLPWVKEFAFEFIDYVPWEELEMDKEPLYLPCPLPIGLIGEGVISGVSFHKTVIPKYRKKDLAERLTWLLNNGKVSEPEDWSIDMSSKKFGPVITPNKLDCKVSELSLNQYYKLLISGEGEIVYTPHGDIKQKNVKRGKKQIIGDMIIINGRAPNSSFGRLIDDQAAGKLDILEMIDVYDKDNKRIEVWIEPKKKATIKILAGEIWKNYLIKKLNFKCYTCDIYGRVNLTPIDTLLLDCYSKWKEAWNLKLNSSIIRVNEKRYNNSVTAEIKKIITGSKSSISSVDDIISKFDFTKTIEQEDNTSNGWKKINHKISEEDVRSICSSSSVQKLVEHKDEETKLGQEFDKIKTEIKDLDVLALKRIKDLTK